MKAHPAFLALTVLCLGNAALMRGAWAQTRDPPPEVPPPAPPVPAAPPPPPAPTPVDTGPPTAVNAPPPDPPAPTPALPTPPPAPAAAPALDAAAPAAAPAAAASATPVNPDIPLPPVPPAKLVTPRYRDAHHDRLLITPTAETNPKGSFYITSYEIILLQIGYAISDFTQVSITATPPLGPDAVVPGDISIKTVVLREPRVSVAAIASATGILGFEEFSGFLGRAGGAVTLCADPHECRLCFSLGTSLALAGPASIWFNGVGVNFRVSRLVSLIAELDTLLPLSEPVGEANGALGGVGVRLSGRAWGVDLALLKAGKARSSGSDLIPFIAGTYRYVP
ncbi:MAG TPA: hypothetical protein VJN18_21115 [Polyangiaceae bacterium]|nr:hypothetical protein [Polyangiaceae bacterium]